MDLMQMAGHLSLEFGAVVEGPFREPGREQVIAWLSNRRGVSMVHREGIDDAGTVEVLVIRETVPAKGTERDETEPKGAEHGGEEPKGTPWRADYSTPVTAYVLTGANLDTMRAVMRILRELPDIDVRDQRDTRELRQPPVHYGADMPACGSHLADGSLTQSVKGIRCLPCMREVHRAV